jgi:hypothetical protein
MKDDNLNLSYILLKYKIRLPSNGAASRLAIIAQLDEINIVHTN